MTQRVDFSVKKQNKKENSEEKKYALSEKRDNALMYCYMARKTFYILNAFFKTKLFRVRKVYFKKLKLNKITSKSLRSPKLKTETEMVKNS